MISMPQIFEILANENVHNKCNELELSGSKILKIALFICDYLK